MPVSRARGCRNRPESPAGHGALAPTPIPAARILPAALPVPARRCAAPCGWGRAVPERWDARAGGRTDTSFPHPLPKPFPKRRCRSQRAVPPPHPAGSDGSFCPNEPPPPVGVPFSFIFLLRTSVRTPPYRHPHRPSLQNAAKGAPPDPRSTFPAPPLSSPHSVPSRAFPRPSIPGGAALRMALGFVPPGALRGRQGWRIPSSPRRPNWDGDIRTPASHPPPPSHGEIAERALTGGWRTQGVPSRALLILIGNEQT